MQNLSWDNSPEQFVPSFSRLNLTEITDENVLDSQNPSCKGTLRRSRLGAIPSSSDHPTRNSFTSTDSLDEIFVPIDDTALFTPSSSKFTCQKANKRTRRRQTEQNNNSARS